MHAAKQVVFSSASRGLRRTWTRSYCRTAVASSGQEDMASEKPRFTPTNFSVDKQEAFASLQLRSIADKVCTPLLLGLQSDGYRPLTTTPACAPLPVGWRRACQTACEPVVVALHGARAAADVE